MLAKIVKGWPREDGLEKEIRQGYCPPFLTSSVCRGDSTRSALVMFSCLSGTLSPPEAGVWPGE